MSTIRRIVGKRATVYRAEIHVAGQRESKRFPSKREAEAWAVQREVLLSGRGVVAGMTVGDALARYAREVSPGKRGGRWEIIRLVKLQHDDVAAVPLESLTRDHADAFVARSRERVTRTGTKMKPASITRELGLLKTVLRECVRWRWLSAYPWSDVRSPGNGRAREKLYSADELAAITTWAGLDARSPGECITTRSQEVGVLFLLGCATAMRLGEMTALTWGCVDLDRRVVRLEMTKNGSSRDVPLSPRALELFGLITRRDGDEDERVFRVSSASASQLFMRVRRKAGIDDGTFHDARHYATTHLAKKLPVMDLARVTGHKDLKMLLRYYRPDAEALAAMLDD